MRKWLVSAAAALALLLCAAALQAEVEIAGFGSTGLALDGQKGYLGPYDDWDRIVVRTDEPIVFLLFFWNGSGLEPRLRVEKNGALIADLDLAKGNTVRLEGGGEFKCTISARAGSGHWFCVLLSGREWD